MDLDHFGSGMTMLDKIYMEFKSGRTEDLKIAQVDIPNLENVYLRETIQLIPRKFEINHGFIRFGYHKYIGYYEKEDLYLYL